MSAKSNESVVVVFSEGEFDSVQEVAGDRWSWGKGAVFGADLYGAGALHTYVWPEERAAMIDEEDEGEVAKAMAELAKRETADKTGGAT